MSYWAGTSYVRGRVFFFGCLENFADISWGDIEDACGGGPYSFDQGSFYLSGEHCGYLQDCTRRGADRQKVHLRSYGVKAVEKALLEILYKARAATSRKKALRHQETENRAFEQRKGKRKRLEELARK